MMFISPGRSPDAPDGQPQGDALAEEGDAQYAHGQPDGLQAVLRREQAGHPMVHREPRPQTEDTHTRDKGGDIPGEKVFWLHMSIITYWTLE